MTEVVDRDDPRLAPIAGISVIDVDTHLTEPADLWTSRAPAKYKDLVPRVETVAAPQMITRNMVEMPSWVAGDGTPLGLAGAGAVINRENQKIKGSDFIHWPLTEASPAASYVGPRLDIMDEVGIWAQIVYPNVVGFGGQNLPKIGDPDLALMCVQIWNDAMAENQEESGSRLFGMGVIPWWDCDLAIAEVKRIQEIGLKGMNTTPDPQDANLGLPDLSDPHWDRLWGTIAELGLPVNFHIGASQTQNSWFGTSPWPSFDNDAKLAIGSAMLYIGNARVIANLVFSGLFDRHPSLKVVSAESGVGWIPFMLEALDYQGDEMNAAKRLKLKPSEYFARNMYACTWFERDGLLNDVQRLGIDNCMFETDFPHPTCLYPSPLTRIAESLIPLSYEDRRKLLSTNAAKVYNIDLPEPSEGAS